MATDESKNRIPVLSFKRIIAACCYLQYFQSQSNLMINDVLQACQKLNVKAIKALDFIDKWAAYLKHTHPRSEDGMQTDSGDDEYAIIRFSKAVKKKSTKKESPPSATDKKTCT